MNIKPITAKGAELLREELERLKKIERPGVIQAIAEARAHGDLKENAEYHAAKEKQGFIEGRIKHIEHTLSHSQVIDISNLPVEGKVIFGMTAKLINTETGDAVTYQIVGEDEADVKIGKISYTSPVARAIIGKEIDDVVIVQAPAGSVEYLIEEIF